jgi:hypothetical protein
VADGGNVFGSVAICGRRPALDGGIAAHGDRRS